MAISNSYPKGIPVEDADLFVGTKGSNNRTVNYIAQGVANYLNINAKVSIGGQMSFQFSILPDIPKTISFDSGGGNNTAFSAISKLIVSAIDLSTTNITIFLNYLNNSQVLLSQQNQPNFFGHYKITGYTQIGTSAFYELDLEFIGGNGTINDKQYYDLVSFVLSTEAPVTEWGSITGDIEDQTDLINYISSQITTPTLQSVTDEGNETTNSIIVEDNIILIKDNYNTTYFEINGYELIGKDLTTNKSYFQLGYDGQMYAFYPPTVSYIQSLRFNTNGVPFQDYEFPSKPSGTYTLATTDDVPLTPTLQEVLDEGNSAVDSGIFFSNTTNDFETSVNEFGDGKIILKSVVNDVVTEVIAGQVYLGTIDGTDNAIINKDGINVDTVNYAFPSGASSPLATLADIPLPSERRNANNSSNNNINYCGTAANGSAESATVWTITRLTIAASGSITTAVATNVAWTNRESVIY
jgi:hypothetical protein